MYGVEKWIIIILPLFFFLSTVAIGPREISIMTWWYPRYLLRSYTTIYRWLWLYKGRLKNSNKNACVISNIKNGPKAHVVGFDFMWPLWPCLFPFPNVFFEPPCIPARHSCSKPSFTMGAAAAAASMKMMLFPPYPNRAGMWTTISSLIFWRSEDSLLHNPTYRNNIPLRYFDHFFFFFGPVFSGKLRQVPCVETREIRERSACVWNKQTH